MIGEAFRQVKRYFKSAPPKTVVRGDLDVILDSLSQLKTLTDRLDWLVRLLSWIRHEGHYNTNLEKEAGVIPATRIRYLLMVLDRNPAWKKNISSLLREIIGHISAREFFTETGMAKEFGFFGEISDRFMQKILPQNALDQDLSSLFIALFPDRSDILWLQSIDEATFTRIVQLFYYENNEADQSWNRIEQDLEDALNYIVIQCRAIGLSSQILQRLENSDFRKSPFYELMHALENFTTAYHKDDQEQIEVQAQKFKFIVYCCQKEVRGVSKYLEENGVSINIVYYLARLEAYLMRMETLIDCLTATENNHRPAIRLLSILIEDNQEARSVKSFISQNISLLSRKVVERSAKTGEHYITRTKEEYYHLLKAALGGGMLTAFTVYLKTFIGLLKTEGLVHGLLSSLNYSFSFVLIHFCGFTLGTKQPAMTAPALAEKMKNSTTETGHEELITEIVHIIRSQATSILGNLLAVIPTVLIIDTAFYYASGSHITNIETAQYSFQSVDILGPTIIYAAFTGLLLWLSSVIAGWADNWFAFHNLRKILSQNPRLISAFGKIGARKTALFFQSNMSGVIGSIALGFLLGLSPELLKFIGIPLDVRHVTLSSGALAAAIPTLGWEIVYEAFFWRALIGILFIGMINVGVSFGLALWVSSRATNVQWKQEKYIYKSVFKRLFKNPFSFLFPVGRIVREAQSQTQENKNAP